MDRERHRLVKRLFEGALDLAGEARAEFLERECGSDDDLRREVETLVRHDEANVEGGDAAADIVGHAAKAVHAATGLPPSSIGRYAIEREIGRGGMGVVYLGVDPSLDRRVAIKTLPRRLAEDPQRLALLEREARLVAALSHPNIAVVHSLEEADGRRFLTMEFIEGENLSDRIARGTLDVEEAVSIARGLARALEAAHAGGVIHRDVKPGNVRVTPDGLVKVLDFGIAGAADTESGASGSPAMRVDEHAPTRATPVPTAGGAGTPRYMSPERLGGDRGDARSDMWAFGSVVVEMLCGEPVSPRRGLDPDSLPRDVPDRLRDLLAACLAERPGDRPPTMTVVRRRMDVIRRTLRASAHRRADHEPSSDRNRVPRPLSSFVGRSAELNELNALLDGQRLVTLTGLGGTGKTRLAIEAAHRAVAAFPGGVVFVSLAPADSAAAAVREIGTTLGVAETPARSPLDGLAEHVGAVRMLLVLDNCEHIVDACADLVVHLFDRCPSLVVLATSREPLHVPGETVYRVPSLRVPEDAGTLDVDSLLHVDSVRLFVDRATAAIHGFSLNAENAASIADICQRLDGIPLALELAAARTGTIGVADIAARLDHRFRLLVGNKRTVLPRQRTLRSVIDWSHEQLDDEQRALFRRLAVFAGGWSLDAAEAVVTGPYGSEEIVADDVLDLLTELVDKSLVELASVGATTSRFRLLESVHEYARGHLAESGEEEKIRAAHARYFAAEAKRAEPHLKEEDQAAWMDALETDRDNHHAACRYALSGSDPTAAARHMIALDEFWYVRGHWRLALDMLELAMSHPGGISDPMVSFDLRFGHWLNTSRLGLRGPEDRLEPLVEDARLLEDDRRLLRALNSLAIQVGNRGDLARERALYEEVIEVANRTGNFRMEAIALYNLGSNLLAAGDVSGARDAQTRGLEIRRREGLRRGVGMSLGALGEVAQHAGRHEEAMALLGESIDILRELGDHAELTQSLVELSHSRTAVGKPTDGAEPLREALRIAREKGTTDVTWQIVHQTAFVVAEADPMAAATLLGTSESQIDRPHVEGLTDAERERNRALLERTRAALPEGEADRAHERGRALSLEEGLRVAESAMATVISD